MSYLDLAQAFKISLKNYFICKGVLSSCMSVYCVRAWCLQGQNRELDPVGPELQVAVSCHVGAGVEPRSSARAASALNC